MSINIPRGIRVVLWIIASATLILLLMLAVLHFTGVIPIHRVPKIVAAAFQQPERAETTNPLIHETARFRFQYPSNWEIDTRDTHYDPNAYLAIDCPRHGQICLQVLAAEVDEKEAVKQIADRFELPGLRLTGRSEFDTWGQLDGHGIILNGEKFGKPFQVRLFAHGESERSLVVWEYWLDGSNSINASGFKLVEDTFQFVP